MVISFSKKLYKKKAIKKSADAYKELALFQIKEVENEIKVEVKMLEELDESLFKDEFCNYVMSEIQEFK